MNFSKKALIFFVFTTYLFAGNYTTGTPNSNAIFTLQKQETNITGIFNDISGTFEYNEITNQLIALKGEINTSAVSTADEKRDEHIKSEDILNIKKFPKIIFKVTKIEGNDVYSDLTIKGVTKNIKFNLENQAVLDKQVIFTLSADIKRSYFDLSWDELLPSGSSSVSNNIKLTINIQGNLLVEPPIVQEKKVEEKTKKKQNKKSSKKVVEK